MSISVTQMLVTASFGTTSSGTAGSRRGSGLLFDTLSAQLTGTFDPTAVTPTASLLIDLTGFDNSGQSTFAILTATYDSRAATFNRLSSLYTDQS